ncbi:MAG: ABC transporter substrate-binding protein/permease [Acutalibacteraceae bacterium]
MKKFYKYLAFVSLIFFGFLLDVSASNCLDDIKSRGYVKVSTNAEFEPFEYKDGKKMVGIDIDIAQKIAEKLGVELIINDVSFDAVILELLNRNCDFAISAMSASEEKSKNVDFSDSYYVSKQMVIVPQSSDILSLEDLHGKRIGVALGFTGDIYCTENFVDSDIQRYSKATDAVLDLVNHRLDAVVVDDVPAKKLVKSFGNQVKLLDECLFREDYRIAVPKGEKELLNYINFVLNDMKKSGEIDNIVSKYTEVKDTKSVDLIGQIYRNLIYKDRYKMILSGLCVTLEITAVALIMGIILGILVSIVKVSRNKSFIFKILKFFANVYLTIIRGTPVVVQLFTIYYLVLCSTGLNKIFIAMIAFGINSGAYVAETMRAGLQSVDSGQYEAGRSLGLSSSVTMKKIVLPQAFKNCLPTLVSEFIQLIKETAVAGFIGITDLSRAGDIIRSQTYEAFVPLITVAAIYLVIVVITTCIMSVIERRLRASDKR